MVLTLKRIKLKLFSSGIAAVKNIYTVKYYNIPGAERYFFSKKLDILIESHNLFL